MKIGIEIHQRLDTSKLFCDCPTRIEEDEKPKLSIQRMLHPVLSELGEVDEASQAEFAKGRLFTYQVFGRNNCLVEIDEEPPKTLNEDALRIALQMAVQLHAKCVDEVHLMRKMVIDGSNTSGFQRTAVVAINGHMSSSKGTIGIPLIAIEEESAGIVSASDSEAVYRLDRLGIPLIEISTTPDIKDGAHLVEVAERLGMMLRATGRVARGLGTIRQDVNISTEGGARVELKGAQDLKLLPKFVEIEEKRQLELVKIILELRDKKTLQLKKEIRDVTALLKDTRAGILADGIKAGNAVLAQKLPGHNTILGREIQPGKRYGTELSDYARKAGVKGIIHSDESMEKYGISKDEVSALRKELGMDADDAFIMVVAPKPQGEMALGYAMDRANMDRVPEETRRANPDGTSSFMRPLAGRARLYPETDVPPLRISKEFMDSVAVSESLDDKKMKLEALLNKEMAGRVLKSRNLHLFEKLVESGAEPMLAATTLEDTLVALRREGMEFADLENTLLDMFAEYKKGTFVKAAIPEVLKGMAKGARIDAVLKVYRLQKLSGNELEKMVAECGYDMTKVMQKYRLQVDAQEVAKVIKEGKKEHDKDFI